MLSPFGDGGVQMKKVFLLIAVIGLLVLGVSAQKSDDRPTAMPDLSGTWEQVKPVNPKISSRTLTITHNGDEIVIQDDLVYEKKNISNRYTLYADDRGEDNKMMFPNGDAPEKVRSKTKWNKGKLVRNTRMDNFASGFQVIHTERVSYSLSPDGNELTVETFATRQFSATNGPPNVSSFKWTYRRKS